MTYLLDASALLALFFAEPGEAAAREVLDESAVSAVSALEVLLALRKAGMSLATAREVLDSQRLPSLPFEGPAIANACLCAPVTGNAISLGDRACLGTAMAHGLTAVTADRAWKDFETEQLRVKLIR